VSGKLLGGLAVLHVLCCGLPLLIAAGAFAGFGAVLGNGLLVATGVAALAVAFAVRRVRRGSDAACCAADAMPQGLIDSGRG
jgi:uncharacterized membrane protein